MKTKIVAFFTTLVIMAGIGIMSMGAANAAPYDSFVQTIVDRTNQLRAANGLAPVTFDGNISAVSQDWAQHLYTETQDPMWDPSTVHRYDAGISLFPGAVYASENVAINSDADRIFAAWRDSPGHLANMLSKDAQSIGVGYVKQTAGPYAGQYIAVENFAGYGVAATPTATPQAPSVLGSEITIPATEGVEYLINGQVVSPGTYPVSGFVAVDARAAAGYILAENIPTHWEYNFAADVAVSPFAPSFDNAAKTYTIPATEGVEYFVNGAPVAAGTYDGAGTLTVNAYAVDGYVINPGATAEWSFTYTDVLPTATPTAPASDLVNKTYTIPSVAGVDYLVDGSVVRAGTYTATAEIVTITAQAQRGYVLDANATTNWTVVFSSSATEVETAAPTFNDVDRTYEIPAVPGVQYGVNGNLVAPGTYKVNGNETILNVDAFAANSGFVIKAGSTTNWKHTFAALAVEVNAVAPTQNDADRTIVIPSVEGLQYSINGEVLTGTKTFGNEATNVTVYVRPLPGYVLTAGSQVSWNFSFAAVDTTPAEPIKVEAVAPAFDEATRTLTLPTVDGVDYLVNGELTTGTKKTAGPEATTYTVTVRAKDGYALTNATSSWAYTFAAVNVEVPPTLVKVEATVPTVDEAKRTVTIPTVEGVEYVIDGNVVTGTKTAGDEATTFVITARAATGYELVNTPQAPWTFSFAKVVVVDPTPVDPTPTTPPTEEPKPTTPVETPAPTQPSDTPAVPGTPPSDSDVVVVPPTTDGTYIPVVDTDAPVADGEVPATDDSGLTEANKGDITLTMGTSVNNLLALTVSGLTPGGEYEIVLHSDPMNLGKFIADANGEITVEVPESLPAGDHKIAVYQNGDLVGWQGFNKPLAATGADANVLLYGGIAGIAFLMVGGAAYGFATRRKVAETN